MPDRPDAQTPGASELTRMAAGVLAICFTMNVLARGLGESFAVFLLPVTEDLGWSRSAFSTVYAAYMVAQGVAAPIAGALSDRFGAKAIYAPALAIFGLGLLTASVMTNVWQAILGPGLMVGIGVAGGGMAVATGLISRWFPRNLTLAISVAYAGLSVGMITLAPLTQLLIEAGGWRFAYRVMGIALLILSPLLLLAPWRRISTGAADRPVRSIRLDPGILTHRTFWELFAVFFFTSFAIWSVMLQTVAYLTEIGFSPLLAATAYGAVGAMSVIGVVGTGWLADRRGRRLVMTLSFSLTILGVILLWRLGAAPSGALLVLFVLVFGITMGARGPVVSALVARLYPANVGAVFGAVTIGLGLGSAAGGVSSGFLHDFTGGYDAIFALSTIAALIALAPFWTSRPIADGRWPQTSER